MRVASAEGNSFPRGARLRVTAEEFELGCNDDLGSFPALARIQRFSVTRVRFKERVITPGHQLLQPVFRGVFAGLVLCGVLWFMTRDTRVISDAELIRANILLVLGAAAASVVVGMFKVVWANLGVVVVEGSGQSNLEFAIETSQIESVLNLARSKAIPVERM
jgi:hypothetical protein